MPATFDQLYARLDGFGVNMKAIEEMGLPLGQLQDLCQRIENLVSEQAEEESHDGAPLDKHVDVVCQDSF